MQLRGQSWVSSGPIAERADQDRETGPALHSLLLLVCEAHEGGRQPDQGLHLPTSTTKRSTVMVSEAHGTGSPEEHRGAPRSTLNRQAAEEQVSECRQRVAAVAEHRALGWGWGSERLGARASPRTLLRAGQQGACGHPGPVPRGALSRVQRRAVLSKTLPFFLELDSARPFRTGTPSQEAGSARERSIEGAHAAGRCPFPEPLEGRAVATPPPLVEALGKAGVNECEG